MANYKGKPIGDYTTDELKSILADMQNSLDQRDEASKHEKFNIDKEVNNRKIPKMDFPPPNKVFLELKSAIENELSIR